MRDKIEILSKLLEKPGALEKLESLVRNEEDNETASLSWQSFRVKYEKYIKNTYSISYYSSVMLANRRLEEYFGEHVNMSDIKLQIAEEFMMDLIKKVKKGYRVYYRNIKAMFNKAVDWGYIEKNPFIKLKLPKKQENVPLFINYEELNKILKEIRTEHLKEIIIFAFYTGCRLNEIINLSWANINFKTKSIMIGDRHFITKSRKQRIIPMCGEVYELLLKKQRTKTYPINNDLPDYIFCKSDGRTFSKDYVSKAFKNACKKTEIDEGIHFHSLRHSFASNLVQNGIALYTVKELLGHGSIVTTEVYSHLNLNSLHDAVSIFDRNKSYECGKRIYEINSGEYHERRF